MGFTLSRSCRSSLKTVLELKMQILFSVFSSILILLRLGHAQPNPELVVGYPECQPGDVSQCQPPIAPGFPGRADDPVLKIQKQLALYSYVIDSKNFEKLDVIFETDLKANFSTGDPGEVHLSSAEAIASIEKSLEGKQVYTTLNTIFIEVQLEFAISWSRVHTTFFGNVTTDKAPNAGGIASDVAHAYGIFTDYWHLQPQDDTWTIFQRKLTPFVSGIRVR
jgi:hypothetical protein